MLPIRCNTTGDTKRFRGPLGAAGVYGDPEGVGGITGATIAKAAGYGPNDLLQIGFDTSPQIMSAFEKGYVHLTSDQQPFLQGYLPVLSLCQTAVLGTGAIMQDTGAGFVDTNNYKAVKALADAGLR